MAKKPGRNDPCPCGSGRKYKRCCLGKHEPPLGVDSLFGDEPDDLDELMERAKEEFSAAFAAQNRAPIDDFQGLSADAMNGFLNAPFDSPQWVRFAGPLAVQPEAPVSELFRLLWKQVKAGGEKGLKLTAKGNLPRKACREIAQAFWGEDYDEFLDLFKLNTETDFLELHLVRLSASEGGLLRKQRGHLMRTRKGRDLMDQGGLAATYPELLRSFVRRINWAYADRHPELPIVQHGFVFSLYLLWRFGDTPRDQDFYAPAFVRAFPMAPDMIDETYVPTDEEVQDAWALRTIERFWVLFGLIDRRLEPRFTSYRERPLFSATALLKEVVHFPERRLDQVVSESESLH